MNLEQLERFSAKICRTHGDIDPISQMNKIDYRYLDAVLIADCACSVDYLATQVEGDTQSTQADIDTLCEKHYLIMSELGRVSITELGKQKLANDRRVHALMALEMTASMSDEEAHLLDSVLHRS